MKVVLDVRIIARHVQLLAEQWRAKRYSILFRKFANGLFDDGHTFQ